MKVTKQDISRMRTLKSNGKSYEQIRRITGYSVSTIRKWVNDDYRLRTNQRNLERYHRTKDDPKVRERIQASRKKSYEAYGY